MIPDIDNWIINLGAVITALIVIGGAAWKYLISPMYDLSVGDKLDCLTQKLEAYAEDTATQIAKVNGQLTANGGSSLKDQTNRIEATLQKHITGEHERTRVLAIELKATNKRVDGLLRDGHLERINLSQQLAEHAEGA